ncbi:hypothetical protein EV702DRAFT_1079839 [Suillus placidus]|uniref:Secreted protein n=1 Tax=Suillus placidus TaxID=48579 RepID=A0A9P7D6E5_9AGAM|nr:hypothetical protein EV702DRAFT_1079839 [Suillus placidus]
MMRKTRVELVLKLFMSVFASRIASFHNKSARHLDRDRERRLNRLCLWRFVKNKYIYQRRNRFAFVEGIFRT